ncbi:hypothetical protein R1flu_020773 [Riccia fluitans]|uniref:Uncharacterized protein n=1 Tax=Riccia fluitans TaxID=41844 RepID=A0ABD1ZMT5_9MARC
MMEPEAKNEGRREIIGDHHDPYISQIFESHDAAFQYYSTYAKSQSFSARVDDIARDVNGRNYTKEAASLPQGG